MKSLFAVALSLALALPSLAGGPVVVVEEAPVVVEESPSSGKGLLPWLMVPLVLCVVMCGEDEAE